MTSPRLKQAISFIQQGKSQTARKLLLAELKDHPSSLAAWTWAVQVAKNEQEKIFILKKILSLQPDHPQARAYLTRLEKQAEPETVNKSSPTPLQTSEIERSKQSPGILSWLMLVVDLFASLPLSCGMIILAGTFLLGGVLYFRANTDFFGFAGTDFDQLQISNSYQDLTLEDSYWKVVYEGGGRASFTGTVRHVSPIRIQEFGILTHDVLVTSADFADPDLVNTNVVNHKFTWYARGPDRPTGQINLLHTVPVDAATYQALLDINKWDQVEITGYEIYTITGFESDGSEVGVWKDAGCNTLLVESVLINGKGD